MKKIDRGIMINKKNNDRTLRQLPKIKYRPGLPARLMEIAVVLLLVAAWVFVGVNYERGSESSSAMLITVLCGWVGIIALMGIAYMPSDFYNLPFRLTPANIAVQYALAVRLIRILNVILACIYLFSVVACLHEWALTVVLALVGLMVLALIVYFVLAYRCR